MEKQVEDLDTIIRSHTKITSLIESSVLPFIDDKEKCISLIRDGITRYDDDMKSSIPAGIRRAVSAVCGVFDRNYDVYGNAYLPDQINPEKIVDYIEGEGCFDIDHEALLCYVCHEQAKAVNTVYTRMKDEGVWSNVNCALIENMDKKTIKKAEKQYIKLYCERQAEKPKVLRKRRK